MPRLKLPEKLKAHATAFAKQQEVARLESNTANRLKTALRNAVKAHWTAEELPIGSYIRAGGLEFKFEATETSVMDVAKIYGMIEDGELTIKQFLSMCKIDSKQAANVLGGDVVASCTTTKIGNKADIRVDTLSVENAEDEYIEERSAIKTRTKRRVIGSAKLKVAEPAPRQRRRILTRKGT